MSHSLRSAPSPQPSDLSLVPTKYHDLSEVFNKNQAVLLPPHQFYVSTIDLHPGAPFPSSQLFNLSGPQRVAMGAGKIRLSSSPLSSGFFFVEKNEKLLWPCIGYRGMNNKMVKNKYPLPLITSAFEPLHGPIIFTKLDLRNACVVRIRQGDEWKTTFNTPLGHYEYLVMPSVTNARAIFHTLVNNV